SALAAKAATTTIPIVFMTGIEPVQGSLILSLIERVSRLVVSRPRASADAARHCGVSRGEQGRVLRLRRRCQYAAALQGAISCWLCEGTRAVGRVRAGESFHLRRDVSVLDSQAGVGPRGGPVTPPRSWPRRRVIE